MFHFGVKIGPLKKNVIVSNCAHVRGEMCFMTPVTFKKKICLACEVVFFRALNTSYRKYAYILETIYLRHKVTIDDLYINSLSDTERSNQGQT